MRSVASSGFIVRLSFVIVAEPPVSATAVSAVMPALITPAPLAPAAPLCARSATILVVAGKPLRLTSIFALAPMVLPVESFASEIVTVAVPLPLASASVIGGTTSLGERSAVKTKVLAIVGVGVGAAVVATATGAELAAPEPAPPHAATTRPAMATAMYARFMVPSYDEMALLESTRRSAARMTVRRGRRQEDDDERGTGAKRPQRPDRRHDPAPHRSRPARVGHRADEARARARRDQGPPRAAEDGPAAAGWRGSLAV